MRTKLVLLLIIIGTLGMLFAFSAMENTRITVISAPASCATTTSISSALSLKGYETIHIIGALAGDATATTLTVTAYTRETSTASDTDTIYSATTVTVNDGKFELEVRRLIERPWLYLSWTPSATCTVSIVGVLYGADSAPF